jgi:hypothetical protein
MINHLPIDILIIIIKYLSYIDTLNLLKVFDIYNKICNDERYINHMDLDKKIFDKIRSYLNNFIITYKMNNIDIFYKYSYKNELEIIYKTRNKSLIYNKIFNLNGSFAQYIKNIMVLDICSNCNMYLYGDFLTSILYNKELLFPINISINCSKKCNHQTLKVDQSYLIINKINNQSIKIIFNYNCFDLKYEINEKCVYF